MTYSHEIADQAELPATSGLLALSNELLSLITMYLDPSQLVPLLKTNRALYHRVLPILWQHIQFFDNSIKTDYLNFSNVNHRYLTTAPTSHRKTKSIAARVNPGLVQMDKLAASLYMGHVSHFALASIQQLTFFTQNRFSGQPSFAKFVEETLLAVPGRLPGLRAIRVINDASGVISRSNPHHFDDHTSMATLMSAVSKFSEWTQAKRGVTVDIFVYARNPKLVSIIKALPALGDSITFFHMEFAESVDDTLNVCNMLQKIPRLRVFSLMKAKLRRVFSHRDSNDDIMAVCAQFMATLNELHELESLSIVSSLLIMNLDFTQLPHTLQNLELNNQISTREQYRSLGPGRTGEIDEELRTWHYFLTEVALPPRLRSLRLNHISRGSPLARTPITMMPASNKFVNLTELNLIGHDMPPGSDVTLFTTFGDLVIVTINAISHTGLQVLVERSGRTLRELTIARPSGGVIATMGSEELLHDETIRHLRHCHRLEYLYLTLAPATLRGETMAAVLAECRYLDQVYFEYTGFSLATALGEVLPLPPPPNEYPSAARERVSHEWVAGTGIMRPTKRARFTRHPDDATAFIECVYLLADTTAVKPINSDSNERYLFGDYRIKPTGFGAGGIYILDTDKFNRLMGNNRYN